MRKPIHPIRKMRRALERHYLRRVIFPPSYPAIEAVLAKEVKPLLDALAIEHGNAPCDEVRYGSGCTTCRLLAAWKGPL